MDLGSPYQSMFPTVDSAVLSVLTRSMQSYTGREISRLAGRSHPACQRVLDRLVAHGLVLSQEAGRARVYTLNWSHLAADPISQLADLRLRLFRRLREELAPWDIPPCHASVFGSAARGDGGIDSDIDVFLVRPGTVEDDDEEWSGQVRALAEAIFAWTGNHAGIAEVGESDLKRLRRDQPPVLDSLRTDAVDIAGTPLRSLLRAM